MPQNPLYEVEKRRAKVARYVARGYSYDEIGDLVGISASQVYKDYAKWREQRVARLRSDHDAAFVETLNGYDEAIRRAWDEIGNKAADPSDRAALLKNIGQLLEKKARLLGLVGGSDGGATTNILAIVHPGAGDEMKRLMAPEKAAEIEAEIIGEFKELPLSDAKSD